MKEEDLQKDNVLACAFLALAARILQIDKETLKSLGKVDKDLFETLHSDPKLFSKICAEQETQIVPVVKEQVKEEVPKEAPKQEAIDFSSFF